MTLFGAKTGPRAQYTHAPSEVQYNQTTCIQNNKDVGSITQRHEACVTDNQRGLRPRLRRVTDTSYAGLKTTWVTPPRNAHGKPTSPQLHHASTSSFAMGGEDEGRTATTHPRWQNIRCRRPHGGHRTGFDSTCNKGIPLPCHRPPTYHLRESWLIEVETSRRKLHSHRDAECRGRCSSVPIF